MFAAKLLANSVVTNNCYIALNMFEHGTKVQKCILLMPPTGWAVGKDSNIRCAQMV